MALIFIINLKQGIQIATYYLMLIFAFLNTILQKIIPFI